MQCFADLKLKMVLGSVQMFAMSISLKQRSKQVVISRSQYICWEV